MHLHLTESSAELGSHASSQAERTYWLNCEKTYVITPVKIDVTAFHEAAGRMSPMSWQCNMVQGTETFLLCRSVTKIYVRYGCRYFRMQAYSNTHHADNVRKVKEVFCPKTTGQNRVGGRF